MKFRLYTIFLPLLVVLLLGFVSQAAGATSSSEQEFLEQLPPELADKALVHRLEEGEPIPAFSLMTVAGQEVSNQTLNGRPTILAFFSIDNDTRRERAYELLAVLKKLREVYGDRVNIFGICSDRKGCDSPEVKKAGGNLTILDDTERVAYALFGIFMMPTAMVIAPQGELLAKLPYSGDASTSLDSWLKVALGELSEEQLQGQAMAQDPERTAEEKQALHHMQLAEVMVARRMYPQAVDEYLKAADLQPQATAPLIEMGFIQLKLERWAAAEEVFLKVMEMDPDSLSAVAGLGLSLHSQGRDDEAVVELEDAANVTRPMPRVLIALAEIYAAKGDKDLALTTYAKAFRQLGRELERCEGQQELAEKH